MAMNPEHPMQFRNRLGERYSKMQSIEESSTRLPRVASRRVRGRMPRKYSSWPRKIPLCRQGHLRAHHVASGGQSRATTPNRDVAV